MSTPVIITFDYALFIAMFPAFKNPVVYPEAMLQMNFDQATCYVDDVANYGWLQGMCRQLALYLMTAHLVYLSTIIAGGEVPGLVSSATIDKISVTKLMPPQSNQWAWWLGTSPFGMQLLALLQAKSVGGWYVGGSAPLLGFGYPGEAAELGAYDSYGCGGLLGI